MFVFDSYLFIYWGVGGGLMYLCKVRVRVDERFTNSI